MTASLLVANRGEIALRIIRTATELGMRTVAVYAADDAHSPHVHAADEAMPLPGSGPPAYLNQAALLAVAENTGATLIHPGYGFLSENAEFAKACAAASHTFVGPDARVLELLGNKTAARRAAIAAEVPTLAATDGPSGVEDIEAFFAAHPGGIMIKALAGGGGRGMRKVHNAAQIAGAYQRCAAEARLGFGDPALFAEALLGDARHIEVQVVAAPAGHQTHALAVGDRDCSMQRRYQKLIEIAPAQGLSEELRRALHQAAVRLCARVGLRGLATVEFLVSGESFVFLEVNPRIQVEHTVTEQTTGLDLVAVQLAIAGGESYYRLGLPAGIASDGTEVIGEPATQRGIAIQLRVNAETFCPDFSVLPSAGTLTAFCPPSGPGVRVDTYGRPGLVVSPQYDSLLAKVIVAVHGSSWRAAMRKADTALSEFGVEGVATNIGFLRRLLAEQRLETGWVNTDFVDEKLPELAAAALTHQPGPQPDAVELYPGEDALRAQLAGTVVEVAPEGADYPAGAQLVVLEAMKMQHVLAAPDALRTVRVLVTPGQVVGTGDPLLVFTRTTGGDDGESETAATDLDLTRADLDEVIERHARTLDEGRPDAVAKRHRQGRRTARENIDDLVDPGSFVEYGALAIAAQRSRRSEEDLIANTPADGLVAGLATIGADRFGRAAAQAVVASYDYTVLAGTQGMRNHAKTDRVFDLAARKRLPVVLFAEGGGGRPGDTDVGGAAGLDVPTFRMLAGLRGRVPLVSVVSGRCFAGNAALAGVCDVIIATPGRQHRDGRAGDDRRWRAGRLPARGDRADRRAAPQRGGRPGRPRRSARGVAGQAIPLLLSGPPGPVAGARPAGGPTCGAAEPITRLRCAPRHRGDRRCRVGAGAAPRLRGGHRHRAGARRGRALRADRQQHPSPRRRHRRRSRRQGRRLPGVVRILWAAGDLAVRHPRLHGGARCRDPGRGAPVRPDVRAGRAADGAARNDHPAQGIRARRDGHGRRVVPRTAIHRRLADRRDRRHGPGGRGAARLPQGAGRRHRSGRTAKPLRPPGGGRLPARQGAAGGDHLRAGRRHRPSSLPGLDHQALGRLTG